MTVIDGFLRSDWKFKSKSQSGIPGALQMEIENFNSIHQIKL